jgi:40S ribosome biogenesis protein Tsr1 and BMS1 C-terminal
MWLAVTTGCQIASSTGIQYTLCHCAMRVSTYAKQDSTKPSLFLQGTQPGIVMAGTYVRIAVAGVPVDAAAAVCGRTSAYLLGQAPPLTALALHKHESKLSVVNMAVTKHTQDSEPVANKEELTFVTGVRTFSARPIISTNEYNSDKFKLEKFMHEGRTCVMSVFAPIAYPPLPVLVVKQVSSTPVIVPSPSKVLHRIWCIRIDAWIGARGPAHRLRQKLVPECRFCAE